MLTLEEKKFVVQQWNITGSWIAIRRAFLKRPGYHAKNLPALSSLKLVVNKFNEFGSITDRIKGKKSAITSTEIKKSGKAIQKQATYFFTLCVKTFADIKVESEEYSSS